MNADMDTPSKPISAAAISIRAAESGDRGAIAELLSASKLVASSCAVVRQVET